MARRVVVTGIGVVSPVGNNKTAFLRSLVAGRSNIRTYASLAQLGFRCRIASLPDIPETEVSEFTKAYRLVKLKSTGILYGCMAGLEAWTDAGLEVMERQSRSPYWESGCIFGSSSNGLESIKDGIRLTDLCTPHKMGGRTAQQSMNSGVSAYLGGIIGLGNQVTTNASEGATGTEAILEAYHRIRRGQASRMMAGSSEGSSHYLRGAYDGLLAGEKTYALVQDRDDCPETASCPLSIRAEGAVPGAGGGALILEELTAARKRNAPIYAEVLGGHTNCGAFAEGINFIRHGSVALEECMVASLEAASVHPDEVSLVSGHLSGSVNDVEEIGCWAKALGRKGNRFPLLNAPKAILGHCLTASGILEAAACVLQLSGSFVHGNPHSRPLHPEIRKWVSAGRIPLKTRKNVPLEIVAKLSMGMGDINSCVIFKKWKGH